MEKEKLIEHIKSEISNGRNVDFEYEINGIPYKIKILATDKDYGINIPSIVLIPMSQNTNNQIVVESNNLETDNLCEVLKQGGQTSIRLVQLTRDIPGPIVVPLIPSYEEAPYFQQLSKECFELSDRDENYRIDEQILRIIEKTKEILKNERGIIARDKIFLNGYSSSGVFAQRFALLHPDLIEIACIGGASGSIPIPTDKLAYPIGISDYEEITGKKFDLESYSKIKFRYYVGELETQNKTKSRFDDDGNPAPMHDMSYFDRSVPTEVGKRQRELLGREMFSRAKKTIQILKSLGIDIEQEIFSGRTHNNRNGVGVNELGDQFINDTYKKYNTPQKKKEDFFR